MTGPGVRAVLFLSPSQQPSDPLQTDAFAVFGLCRDTMHVT